ncbi:MAG TPA: deoxyguanosinetriphosphate triphosphohydrolase [Gammaproteobacteria bacterium]|nr:deoxyguanosinetriphosphate triphosphohydrolase [Gammaproteobacteria bacterium]
MIEPLAAWATCESRSAGRRHPEPPPAYRSEYHRDRDRIIHSTAFRRLVYKTQVFVNHEGDLYRTRLTHSLEVAQIARTVAEALGLNTYLTEAICLAHDLGHTPFGHAGQEALNRCMADHGGFEHNLQSLRVVDELEEKYAEFSGLNLMFETREGILKHCSLRNARMLGDLGRRFVEGLQAGLEAQLANVADEIAYNNHDVDDGLRAGLLDIAELREATLFREQHDAVRAMWPGLAGRRLVHEIVRRMIGRVVEDLVATSRAELEALSPATPEAVRHAGRRLIGFSPEVGAAHAELKQFLRERLYRHNRVIRMTTKAQRTVCDLYGAFIQEPRLLPEDHARAAARKEAAQGESGRARAVADYIAGMTDRFAILEHGRLFDPRART